VGAEISEGAGSRVRVAGWCSGRLPSAAPWSRNAAEHGARGSGFPRRSSSKSADGVKRMLEYKGYLRTVEADDGVFAGQVAGLRDVITFEGATFAEVEQAFRDSIDDYLAFCAERGEPPDRPYSGKIPLRVSPEMHRRAAMRAQAAGMSLNQWIA